MYLLEHEKIARNQAVELLELGKSKVFEILDSLMNKGFLERKGKGRSTYYVLKENGDE